MSRPAAPTEATVDPPPGHTPGGGATRRGVVAPSSLLPTGRPTDLRGRHPAAAADRSCRSRTAAISLTSCPCRREGCFPRPDGKWWADEDKMPRKWCSLRLERYQKHFQLSFRCGHGNKDSFPPGCHDLDELGKIADGFHVQFTEVI